MQIKDKYDKLKAVHHKALQVNLEQSIKLSDYEKQIQKYQAKQKVHAPDFNVIRVLHIIFK